MAVATHRNATITVNSQAWTAYSPTVTLKQSYPEEDTTAFSHTGKRRLAGSIQDWEMQVDLFMDFADNALDEQLTGLLGASAFAVALRIDSGAIAAGNPEYQGNAMLFDYQLPIKVGEKIVVSVTLKGADGVALIRDITP